MSNPYNRPQHNHPQPPVQQPQNPFQQPQKPSEMVVAPAIALIVVAIVGLLASAVSIFSALAIEPIIDPTDPPFFQQMQQNQSGPLPAAIHSAFLLLNLVILIGAIQMVRFKMWGYSLTASILAMINIGTCCCILGLPVGIWSLIVLFQPQVKNAFE